MERCWYGKFSKAERCPEEGRYGNPEFHAAGRYPGLNATLRFLRASRWCEAHKHDGDRLLEPEEPGASALESARPTGEDAAP